MIFCLFLLTGVSSVTEMIRRLTEEDMFGIYADELFTNIINIITSCFVFTSFVCKPKVLKMLKSEYFFLTSVISAWERIAPCRIFRNENHFSSATVTTELLPVQNRWRRRRASFLSSGKTENSTTIIEWLRNSNVSASALFRRKKNVFCIWLVYFCYRLVQME